MESKVFEIRDRGTCIAILATKLFYLENSITRYLVHAKCGHPDDPNNFNVMITDLNAGGLAHVGSYHWNDRTYQTAHNYINKHFDRLKNGDVVDVEFILGETIVPKKNDCFDAGYYNG